MKLLLMITIPLLLFKLHQAVKIPSLNSNTVPMLVSQPKDDVEIRSKIPTFVKRKGGGGSGGRGSISSGNRAPSSSRSGSGSSAAGSGVRPNYGGGQYYGGGATRPYAAGTRSPSGINPGFLAGSALGPYPFASGQGAYLYPYTHSYSFRNYSARRNNTKKKFNPEYSWYSTHDSQLLSRQAIDQGPNETKSVFCLCAAYYSCGCDDNSNETFLDSLIGNGNYSMLNHTLVQVADVNGSNSIFLNGTLPNGTSADETSGLVRDTECRSLSKLIGLCILTLMVSLLFT
ncbi:hypothetical protein K3495_g13311 [Podosphaera aphanis]|nr:hypothetical protein K3495_g13311 [Podosphaera aphanis]